MKRVNKTILFFGVFVLIVLGAAVKFIQSEMFANFVSDRISKTIQRSINGEVTFKEVEVGLIPLSTSLSQVSIRSSLKDNLELKINAFQISASFGIIDLLANRLSVNQFKVTDGKIKIETSKDEKNETSEDKTISQIRTEIFDFIQNDLPIKVRSLAVEDMSVELDNRDFYISKAIASYGNGVLFTSLKVEEINANFDQQHLEKIDVIELEGRANKDAIYIEDLAIYSQLEYFEFNGVVEKDEVGEKIEGQFELSGQVERYLKHLFTVPDFLGEIKGIGIFSGDLTYVDKELSFDGDLNVKRLDSNVAKIDNLSGGMEFKNGLLKIRSAEAFNDGGRVRLEKPFTLANLKLKKWSYQPFTVIAENFNTNDALYILRENLSTLKGRLTGAVDLSYDRKTFYFKPRPGFKVNEFRLTTKNENKNILINDGFFVKKALFQISDQNIFFMDVIGDMDNHEFNGKGTIGAGKIDIKSEKSSVDFKRFGPIADLVIQGDGVIDLHFHGPTDDVTLDINAELENTSLLEYQLGDVKGGLSYNFEKTKLTILELKGRYDKSNYQGHAFFEFSGENRFKIDLDIEAGNLVDAPKMFYPVLSGVEVLKELGGPYQADIEVSGILGNKGEIIVSGDLETLNASFYGEEFDHLDVNFLYKNEKINFDNIEVRQSNGILKGTANYDFKKEKFLYDLRLSHLSLSDIGLVDSLSIGYRGKMYGEFYGSGRFDNFNSRSQVKIQDGLIGTKPVKDSVFSFYNNGKELFFSGFLAGKQAELDGYLNFNKKAGKSSKINIKFDVDDLILLFGILSEHNVYEKMVSGKLKLNFDGQFDPRDFMKSDAKLVVHELEVVKDQSVLRISKEKNKIIVKNGRIKNWDILIDGNDNLITSVGEGNLSGEYKIDQNFSMDSSFLEQLTPIFDKSKGDINGRWVYSGKNGKVTNFMEVWSEDMDLRLIKSPEILQNLKFRILLDGNQILVDHLSSKYGGGDFTTTGSMLLNFPFPEFNLGFSLENSRLNFFNDTSFVLNSKINLKGEKMPYKLFGEIGIISGTVKDNVDEIFGDKIQLDSYTKYIPRESFSRSFDYVENDIVINLLNTVDIRNSLGDVSVKGKLVLKGVPENPLLEGKLETVSPNSKLVFKGHNFLLEEGTALFDGSDKEINPDLGLVGVAKINEYDVKLDVKGKPKKLDIEFSSNPPLSQEDILSLLTIGLTSDVSKGLLDKDRQSITTIGVGSLLVDQLKINEGLGQTLGLRFSVAPELAQDDDESLLEGRTTESDNFSSRYKSSTKIKIQKKISEDVGLSVSSTVGGSLDQKQDMKINYNINSNLSFDMIYEIRSDDDLEQEEPDSAGADIKIKWSW